MRRAIVRFHNRPAAVLAEHQRNRSYQVTYLPDYDGEPISLTMPVREAAYRFDRFPPFFDGLLPEGVMLDALLKTAKVDRDDPFSQLIAVGQDLVGAVTVEPVDATDAAGLAAPDSGDESRREPSPENRDHQ